MQTFYHRTPAIKRGINSVLCKRSAINANSWTFAILLILLASIAPDAMSQVQGLSGQSQLRKGILPNGLSYYLVRTQTSERKIEFRFVTKAGFFYEGKNERGISHLIEHLGMRATTNFPNGLKNYFQNKGILFGGDLSASTGYNTIFSLAIPTGNKELFDAAFSALGDWSRGICFRKGDIQEETAAVLNEGAKAKDSVFLALEMSKYLLLDSNPLYASTIDSIDFKNILRSSKHSLRAFYSKWYSPDRQAIIIVGEFDLNRIEMRIKSEFSDLKRTDAVIEDDATVNQRYDVSLSGLNKLVIVPHSSRIPTTDVTILKKIKSNPDLDPSKRCESKLMDLIYGALLRDRFDHLKGKPNGVSIISVIERNSIHPLAKIDAFNVYIRGARPDQVKDAIIFVARELARVEKWGFSQIELNRAKAKIARTLERDETPSHSAIANALINNFSTNENVFPEQTCAGYLDNITLETIHQLSKKWLDFTYNTDVAISVPSVTLTRRFTQNDVFSWIYNVKSEEIQVFNDYVERILETPDIDLSKIDMTMETSSHTGVVRLILNNGINVLVKRLGGSADTHDPWNEVALRGFSQVDHGLQYDIAEAAAQIVYRSGLGSLDGAAFLDWKKQRNDFGALSLAPYVKLREVGFTGGADLANFEDLLKLVYLYYLEPKAERDAYDSWKEDLLDADKKKTNYDMLEDTIRSTIYAKPRLKNLANGLMFDEVLPIYKKCFTDQNRFTFIVTGYFELKDVIELLRKYLGALPLQADVNPGDMTSSISKQDLSQVPIANGQRIIIGRDSSHNTQVRVLFPVSKILRNDRSNIVMRVLNELINEDLFIRLRESEKGVYSVTSSLISNAKDGHYYIDVSFQAVPKDVERLVSATVEEVTHSLRKNITDQCLANAISAVRDRLTSSMSSSQQCADILLRDVKNGSTDPDIFGVKTAFDRLDPDEIRTIVESGFDRNQYCVFTLF